MSGLTAIYARKDTTSASGVSKAEKSAKDRELRLAKRWKALAKMHRIIRLPQNRRPGLEDITNLAETFERVLATNDDPLICGRNTFVRVIMQLYLKTDHKAVNHLYSSFDPDRTDMLDYRDFIAALRVFPNPTETARVKLEAIFRIYCPEGETAVPKGVIKQILYTCCASLAEKEHLDDCIAAKVGKQMRAETAIHQRQQYVSRESFLGLAYVDCSGVAACLGGGQRSMAGRASFGIQIGLTELMEALATHEEVEAEFFAQLCDRLEAAGFEGKPKLPRPPSPKRIDLTPVNVPGERLKELVSSPIGQERVL